MKTIDAQSAVPTMFNSFVEYSGTLANTGSLSDGTSIEVPITTEIRQDLHVDAMCRENDVLVPRIFQAFWKKSLGASNVAVVTIEVPSGCTCVYRISGNKELTQPLHKEQGSGVGTVGNQHAGGHRHDGNDSKKILATHLDVGSGNATKFLQVNSGGTALEYVSDTGGNRYQWIHFKMPDAAAYGYDSNYGTEGIVIYVPDSPNWARITFLTYNTNDGVGNHQTGQTLFSVSPPVESLTAGDRIALRFWDDGGTDKLTIYKNGSVYYTIPNPPTPHPGAGNNNSYILGIKFQTTI